MNLPENIFDKESILQAIMNLGFADLEDLQITLANLSTAGLKGTLILVHNLFGAESLEYDIIQRQIGELKEKYDHHQGGGSKTYYFRGENETH